MKNGQHIDPPQHSAPAGQAEREAPGRAWPPAPAPRALTEREVAPAPRGPSRFDDIF